LSLVTFIILNAVILSIAVWNLSIIHYIDLVCESLLGCAGRPIPTVLPTAAATQIDAYLVFLGAFGLLLAFPMCVLSFLERRSLIDYS